MSRRSLSVSADADSPPPWRLMPLLSPSSPPTTTRQTISGPCTWSTHSVMRPSSSSNVTPRLTSCGSCLYVVPTRSLVPASSGGSVSMTNRSPSRRTALPPLQAHQHADGAAVRLGALARLFGALHVYVGQVVGKIEAHHVHAGLDELFEDLRVVRGRAEGGDDFRSTQHKISSKFHVASSKQRRRGSWLFLLPLATCHF